jgi:hypothetical protein
MRGVLSGRLGAYEGETRAGALALSRIVHPDEPQPALPAEETAFVTGVLERWLGECPRGALALGPEAEESLGALLDGWCARLVHAFAAGPLAPEQALEAVGGSEDVQTGEQLAEMEIAGLLSPCEGRDGEMRLAPTEWLRHAIAPLAAAARLELLLPPGETAPIAPLDVEAAFLLTVPLVELPEELYGSCRLTARVPGRPQELAGVVVLIEDGELASVSADLRMDSSNFASAAPSAWIDTLIDPSVAAVDFNGDPRFAFVLLHGLHEELFGGEVG